MSILTDFVQTAGEVLKSNPAQEIYLTAGFLAALFGFQKFVSTPEKPASTTKPDTAKIQHNKL